ncbi:MAG: hypothetical protein EXS36_09620 [Pedosphaera sp.]|nr:hypothetical protein [Pedosphaera sp.]
MTVHEFEILVCSYPRPLHVDYPGAGCHVLNREDRRKARFRDDANRNWFLATLTEVYCKTEWQIHAYCLKPAGQCPPWLRVDRLLGEKRLHPCKCLVSVL